MTSLLVYFSLSLLSPLPSQHLLLMLTILATRSVFHIEPCCLGRIGGATYDVDISLSESERPRAINSEQPPALSDRISLRKPTSLAHLVGAPSTPRTSKDAGSIFTSILTRFQEETASFGSPFNYETRPQSPQRLKSCGVDCNYMDRYFEIAWVRFVN